jgi:hypothetical protein
MFAAQLETAVLGADLHQLDHLSRDLWKAFNAGVIGEDDAVDGIIRRCGT